MPILFTVNHVVADMPADAVDIVYDIRRSIVDGTLKPGELLPKPMSVASEIGVEATLVAAAYEELATLGLLTREGDRTRAIAKLDSAAAQDNIRYVLERRLRQAIIAAARAGYDAARIQALLGVALDAEFTDRP